MCLKYVKPLLNVISVNKFIFRVNQISIMKSGISTLLLVFLCTIITIAQSTTERVYEIFQASCTFSSCHSNSAQAFGLDLQGSGANPMLEVYDNLVNVTPNNSHAAGENNKLIKPGDPARSFLFRKVQNGLDPSLSLHSAENNPMPVSGNALREVDVELIRQWILYGAPETGEVIDVTLIDNYYNSNGVSSVPNPPAKPAEGEGIQIHLGPYFLPPGTEDEVFLKHDLMLEEDIEVVKTETYMGVQSHHFIINKFLPADVTVCGFPLGNDGPESFAEGFRDVNSSSHFAALLQLGAQEAGTFELPYNTAYTWESGSIIDLNSHYINANQNQVLAAEVFVNIYTQEAGMAEQEMNTLMLPQTSLEIPGDGVEVTIDQNLPIGFCYQDGLYLWALTSHTHQYGTDFDIYRSDASGAELEHLFDASCFIDGVPGCNDEFYDYQHPPTREFENYFGLSGTDWLKQEASYVNNSGETVNFGLTSEDEMLIMFLFFVEDTAGLINSSPNLQDDLATTDLENSIIIDVLENDQDDGVLNIETMGVVTAPSNGAATVNVDGTITYSPNDGFSGNDTFTYVICDDGIPPLCDSAEVVVTVNAPSGIFDQSFKVVSAYPNPTTGIVTLSTNLQSIKEVALYDISGQRIGQLSFERLNGTVKVNLANEQLDHGVYWIMIENSKNERAVSKVIFHD